VAVQARESLDTKKNTTGIGDGVFMEMIAELIAEAPTSWGRLPHSQKFVEATPL